MKCCGLGVRFWVLGFRYVVANACGCPMTSRKNVLRITTDSAGEKIQLKKYYVKHLKEKKY